MHLKVLPAQALRDADSTPLVLFQDTQQPRVVCRKVAVVVDVCHARRSRVEIGAAGGRVMGERGYHQQQLGHYHTTPHYSTHVLGMSLSIFLGKMTWRYSKLSSESGRRSALHSGSSSFVTPSEPFHLHTSLGLLVVGQHIAAWSARTSEPSSTADRPTPNITPVRAGSTSRGTHTTATAHSLAPPHGTRAPARRG